MCALQGVAFRAEGSSEDRFIRYLISVRRQTTRPRAGRERSLGSAEITGTTETTPRRWGSARSI